MKKRPIIIAMVVLLIYVGLSGCLDYSFTKSKVEGIWYEGNFGVWNFLENETLYVTYYDDISVEGTWNMDSNYIYAIGDDYTDKYRYTFLDDNNTLLLESIQESHTLKRG